MRNRGTSTALCTTLAVGSGGVGVAEVLGGDAVVSVGAADVGGFLGAAFLDFLGFLGDLAAGLVVGSGIVVVGFLVLAVVVEACARRRAQALCSRAMSTPCDAVLPLAPRTLRWVRGLLPSGEGAAWLAEVTSCLAEAHDECERRRHVRGYRRAVPHLVWTSWVLHLRGSRSRKLS